MTIIRDADTGEVVGRVWSAGHNGFAGKVQFDNDLLGGVVVSCEPTERQARNELYVHLLTEQEDGNG